MAMKKIMAPHFENHGVVPVYECVKTCKHVFQSLKNDDKICPNNCCPKQFPNKRCLTSIEYFVAINYFLLIYMVKVSLIEKTDFMW